MNEKPDPRTRLVADAFIADWDSGPTSAFARRAAAHARRRRATRTTILAGGVVAIAAIFLTSRNRVFISPALLDPAGAPLTRSAPPLAKLSPTYEIISDDELLTLLRDRPLLVLPQENGAKKIVLLGH